MTIVSGKKIIGLNVVTKSGDVLGKVSNFDVEVDSHIVLKYYVGGSNILKKLLVNKLVINKDQVISIDGKKMLVYNSVVKKKVPGSELVDITA